MSGEQQHKPAWPGLYEALIPDPLGGDSWKPVTIHGSDCSWYADNRYALVYHCRRVTRAARRRIRTFNEGDVRAVNDAGREQLQMNMSLHRLGYQARVVG